jgi:hypothetical protein
MTYEEVLRKHAEDQGWNETTSQKLLLRFMQETTEPTVEKFEAYLQERIAGKESPELVTAVVEMMKAKLQLWDASVTVEQLIGFDVETNGGKLDAICGCIDSQDDVTDDDALLLIADLREEQ